MKELSPVIDLSEARRNESCGGKAVNLGNLIRAGFNVPAGFVVTTAAFRTDGNMTDTVRDSITQHYSEMGEPTVAVRSSATAEDMADASMAGQYETFLDIQGVENVIDSVIKCWNSIDTPRTRAYLKENNIDLADVAMAVVVQVLVPAEKAGVLFTVNPRNGNAGEMLVEASWGLGEAVVSGIVQPDTLTLSSIDGHVLEAVIQDKKVWFEPGARKKTEVPEELRKARCLTSHDLDQLLRLGQKVAAHFQSAQDLEWAIQGGELFLLQSRHITTIEDVQFVYEQQERIREDLRAELNNGEGPWVRHNISETLPLPTPLTWDVIRRFMSGQGGYGAMYRKVGFDPSPRAMEQGMLKLVAGRIFMDLNKAGGMFFENFSFRYDPGFLRLHPEAAQGPPTVPCGSALQQMKSMRKLSRVKANTIKLTQNFDREFEDTIMPAFDSWVEQQQAIDLSGLSNEELWACWEERERKVMDEFAPQSLLPSLIGAMVMADLRALIEENFWDEDPDELLNLFCTLPDADLTMLANQGLFDLANGLCTREEWLDKYGHRAPDEFDLSVPRWVERPDDLQSIVDILKDGQQPIDMHRRRAEQARSSMTEHLSTLSDPQAEAIREQVSLAHRYLLYRENGKFHLMRGYELLRTLALEAGRRLEIGDLVFFLERSELKQVLESGYVSIERLEDRKRKREAMRKIRLPALLDEERLDGLGKPGSLEGHGRIPAFSLSSGQGRGPVRIVHSPDKAGELGKGYILVCSSTDPSWTPLFVNAAGLVLECGGTLSHGAVVAREMGIPAVVLPDAINMLKDGEEITVDGHHGAVLVGDAEEMGDEPGQAKDPDDCDFEPCQLPPPAGPIERRSAVIRNIGLVIWGIFFALTYLVFPREMLEHRVFHLIDLLLLPLLRVLGKPFVVGLVASVVAAGCMIIQRYLADTPRLREAKRRTKLLAKEAKSLPKDSLRGTVIQKLVASVQTRITMAALVPLAVLLGPMMMSFMWFPSRVDTAARNAKPGSSMVVTAVIEAENYHDVELSVPDGFEIESVTPAKQRITDYRKPLERYLAKRRTDEPGLEGRHWAEGMMVLKAYEDHTKELANFLENGRFPNQKLVWRVNPVDEAVGRWKFALNQGGNNLNFPVVQGDGYRPEARELIEETGRGGRIKTRFVQLTRNSVEDAGIKEVQVVYQESLAKGEGTFMKLLDRFEAPTDREPTTCELLFSPWLIFYLIIYLPVMFISKAVLRIP